MNIALARETSEMLNNCINRGVVRDKDLLKIELILVKCIEKGIKNEN